MNPALGGGAIVEAQAMHVAARTPAQRRRVLRIMKGSPAARSSQKRALQAVGNKTIAINYASALLLDPVVFSRMGGMAAQRNGTVRLSQCCGRRALLRRSDGRVVIEKSVGHQ